MKNKFEALAAFQSWPEEWQRLCAEYWTETDKPNVSVWTASDKLATAGKLMQSEPQREARPKVEAVENLKICRKARDMTYRERERLAFFINNLNGNQKRSAEAFCFENSDFEPDNIRSHIRANMIKNKGKYRVE